ncbi:lytic murein transglycosylase [Agrobacterium fabrum]|nr:lytic murein transglycosylase [Agrobacterium fabrum]
MWRSWWVALTPLCPAGHLPLKGGDRHEAASRPSSTLRVSERYLLADLPLEGEMPGRAEGGEPQTPTYTFAATTVASI